MDYTVPRGEYLSKKLTAPTLVTIWCLCGPNHPSAISFFRVHTILHDILGFETIITQYLRYFPFGKNARKLQDIRH